MPERKSRSTGAEESREDSTEEPRAAGVRALWSGTIGFGLVSIPVNLFPANRPRRISMRMLGPDGTPLGRRYYAPETGQEIPEDDLVRGYEVEKDAYVLVEDEELEGLAPKKSRDIELTQFVDAAQIDPMLFERAYFLVPAGTSNKAYRLLAETMERTKRAGIATFVMREREYLVAVMAENGILCAETLRFADELRSPEDVGLGQPEDADEELVRQFVSEIRHHSAPSFDVRKLKDEQAARLMDLAEQKKKRGEGVVRAPEEAEAARSNVIDLMAVLKRSLRGDTEPEAETRSESRAASGESRAARAKRASPGRTQATRRGAARRVERPRATAKTGAKRRARTARAAAETGGKPARASR